jgi:hypothetical protein
MGPTTDERLKSFLDTNQQAQERMCLAVLATDKRYSEIRPRHPQGGPDGGRDIEAKFQSEHLVFGAVGFVGSANDTSSNKTAIKKKFKADLQKATGAIPRPKVFTFFTNVRLTINERDKLRASAINKGLMDCEIYDRERIRFALDSPDGLAARFQYLRLPMSEAEQASFFARWGDDIQSVISTGFGRLETKLSQILFSQEASDPLDHLYIRIQLDRPYPASDIGHFRAFAIFNRGELAEGLFGFLFGASDRQSRMREQLKDRVHEDPVGISAGISYGQWIQLLKEEEEGPTDDDKWQSWSGGSSIGVDPVTIISIGYSQGGLFRIPPFVRLKDLDGGMFVLYANRSLAEKIGSLQVFGNSYKLMDIDKTAIRPEFMAKPPNLPVSFTEDELADPWMVLRPDMASTFQFNFSENLPVRFYDPKQVPTIRDRLLTNANSQ